MTKLTKEQQDACKVLESNSCGLEETFLTSGRDFDVNEDDLDWAETACEEILAAIKTLRA